MAGGSFGTWRKWTMADLINLRVANFGNMCILNNERIETKEEDYRRLGQ